MTDQSNNQTTASKAPTHIAYQTREGKDGKDYRTRIGAAWAHKKGNGFAIQLDAVPLDGRVVLFAPAEKSE